jgi:hypothetical protein
MKKLITVLAVLAVAGCGVSTGSAAGSSPASHMASQPSPRPSHTAKRVQHKGCDASLWRHVYHPYRLHVVSACRTVTGTVQEVRQEADGDLHILLRPDARFASLLDSANVSDQNSDLVLEPVCAGAVSQADAEAACSGFRSGVTIPGAGDRIRVTGSYVLDADHGWMEIHPVSRITIIGHGPVPPTSSAPPAPAGCHPVTSGGNCYEPGEFCPHADAGMTGVAGDGKAITCKLVSGSYRWED